MNDNNCPVCQEKAVSNCRCQRRDSECAQGHHWHFCVTHHVKVIGRSDHSKPAQCTCGNKS